MTQLLLQKSLLTPATVYDQYYARLAVTSVPSSQDTPGLISIGSDFGDDDEDDIKPSIQYLDSLNDYRKRSRSHDDVDGGSATPKMAKLNSHVEIASVAVVMPGSGSGILGVGENGIVMAADVFGTSSIVRSTLRVRFSCPFSVNGESVPLSQVTEEHQELMTPEEYTAYYEVLARS